MRITRKKMIVSLLLPCVVALGLWHGAQLSGAEGDGTVIRRAPAVGVVDVERVINEYLKVTGDMDKVLAKFASERRSLDAIRETIDSMRQEADIYPKDTPQYLDIRTRIAVKTAELKVRLEANDASKNREQGKLMLEAFRKAQDVIDQLAKEKGLDLVMQMQTSDIKGIAYEAVSSQLIVRSVLYARDQLDITDDVIARMK
ncbi:MAG TPA: OmpH family outer membrane protein [Planctomycetes bacterium]|nr:OmpH family outer membrane protein [Planctomycetota bacterium]